VDGNVILAWDIPLDDGGYPVIKYHLFRASRFEEHKELAVLNYLKSTYIDYEIVPGEMYSYYITADNILGTSEPSDSSGISIPDVWFPPPIPQIYLTTKGILYIKIHWKVENPGQSLIFDFIVYKVWDEDGDIRSDRIHVGGDTFSYNDTDIEFDVNYTYQVTAVNPGWESEKSNLIDIRVRNLSEPAPNKTVTKKKGPNRALIFGLVLASIIIIIAGVAYFVMTKRGPYELPLEEFELDPEELENARITDDRGGS
jgi:hypothetical protein